MFILINLLIPYPFLPIASLPESGLVAFIMNELAWVQITYSWVTCYMQWAKARCKSISSARVFEYIRFFGFFTFESIFSFLNIFFPNKIRWPGMCIKLHLLHPPSISGKCSYRLTTISPVVDAEAASKYTCFNGLCILTTLATCIIHIQKMQLHSHVYLKFHLW